MGRKDDESGGLKRVMDLLAADPEEDEEQVQG